MKRLIHHIIYLNNRSDSSKYYIRENDSGKISAFNVKDGNRVFNTTEEFLTWFKSHSISRIQERLLNY